MDGAPADYLLTTYGTGYTRVLDLIKDDPALAERISPTLPHVWAEIPHAIRHEMALSLCDFLVRRTHIICEEPNQGLDQARAVAERMATHLGWTPEETTRQVQAYRHEVQLTRRYRDKEGKAETA
jgi:glycerol-3-phosphate dehydrogenase